MCPPLFTGDRISFYVPFLFFVLTPAREKEALFHCLGVRKCLLADLDQNASF